MTVQARLDELGFGPYQVLVLVGVGCALFAENLEMGAVAPLHTAMARNFHLTHLQRTALPMVTFLGSAVGLFFSGPICDWHGRINALTFSLITIFMVMLMTAILPPSTTIFVLLLFRFLAGAAAAIQVPAGLVLAIESCPEDSRPYMVFGIQVFANLGYLLEAIGVQVFMPEFGESDTDAWRSFCLFIGMTAVVALPPALLLKESPSFLAMKGDLHRCVTVLDHIATTNGRSPLKANAQIAKQEVPQRSLWDIIDVFKNLDAYHWWLFLVLAAADSIRGFFVSGSSYLWKDLFQLSRGAALSPTAMNIVASLTPLVGLMISQRCLWLGVRRVALGCSVIAALACGSLADPSVRMDPWKVLVCIMAAKLTYGPLGACISLMKAESFPTEIRVSAYAMISMIAKISNIFSPTLIEAMRDSEVATSWDPYKLSLYVVMLTASVAGCGFLMYLVPGRTGDGKVPLNDFFEKKVGVPRSMLSDGALCTEISMDSESEFGIYGQAASRMIPRSVSVPAIQPRARLGAGTDSASNVDMHKV